MRKILYKILFILLVWALFSQSLIGYSNVNANNPNSYTTFRSVDKDSFNEYRYLITKEFFNIRSSWEVDWSLDSWYILRLKDLVQRWFNYLPDNKATAKYLDNTKIEAITWTMSALPKSWNAPFNVTLRSDITDPTWTNIPSYNYTWWIYDGSRKINILGVLDRISLFIQNRHTCCTGIGNPSIPGRL